MDLRFQRGLELAATRTIRKRDGWWMVPSQSGPGIYRVHLTPKTQTCECPDFCTRQATCKHIFAATFVMKREKNENGTETVTRTLTVTRTEQRTYPQNWPAYNVAQTEEKERFQSLLFDLCYGIRKRQAAKCGRPTLPLSDVVFSATFKVKAPFPLVGL